MRSRLFFHNLEKADAFFCEDMLSMSLEDNVKPWEKAKAYQFVTGGAFLRSGESWRRPGQTPIECFSSTRTESCRCECTV